MTQHLDNAADCLRSILASRHPEHAIIVSVEPDGDDAAGDLGVTSREGERRAEGDHSHPLGHRKRLPTRRANQDRREKVA